MKVWITKLFYRHGIRSKEVTQVDATTVQWPSNIRRINDGTLYHFQARLGSGYHLTQDDALRYVKSLTYSKSNSAINENGVKVDGVMTPFP